jgi:penicillin-binding protein 1A
VNEDGFQIEDEFRAMFAERSEDVSPSAAPYARLRRRIVLARRRRRQRVGGAAAAVLVVAVGVGAWSTVGGSSSSKPLPPDAPVTRSAPVVFTYDDGKGFGSGDAGYLGYMRQAAVDYLAAHDVKVPDSSGYTVVTTFNHQLMDDAVVAADAGLWKTKTPQAPAGTDVHLAFAAVDPATGWVRAFYTGRDGVEDYTKDSADVALAGGVQIGDLMKPITMATALENGYSPDSQEPADNSRQLYWPIGSTGGSNRLQYNDPNGAPHKWPPASNDEASRGSGVVSLTDALAASRNATFADLEMEPTVTPTKVYKTAQAFGISPDMADFNDNPSLTLGVAALSPLRMASVYAAFPAAGVQREPVMVSKVLDASGKVVWHADSTGKPAVSAKTAGWMVDALHNVVKSGTPAGNHDLQSAVTKLPDAGGKTSTTDFHHAAWFDGFTAKLSTAVVMYRGTTNPPYAQLSQGGTVMPLTTANGSAVTGSSFPTSVWARFMELAEH